LESEKFAFSVLAPASINDTAARQDWNWKNDFDLESMTTEMFSNLIKHKYN
jgi:hypothetical protein